MADTQVDEAVDSAVDPVDEGDLEETAPVPWHALMVLEGVVTGDRRAFAEGALRFDENLPYPLFYEHGGSIHTVVGQVSKTWKVGNQIWGSGTFNDSKEADAAIGLIVNGDVRGVSVDADDWESTLADRDLALLDPSAAQDEGAYVVDYIQTARIRGLSLAPIAAFAEAFIALGETPEQAGPERDAVDEEVDEAAPDSEFEAIIAGLGFAPGTHDGPGWITHPKATQRIRRYWVTGKGAAKIRWGQPGDFNRCRKLLAKYIVGTNVSLEGLCANMHKEALKVWPGREKLSIKPCEDCGPVSLVASAAAALKPPAAWFTDPGLSGITPVTVRKDEATGLNRVFGHVAQWGSCHITWSDMVCLPPPSSPSNYAFFMTGETETLDGDVLTGRITLGTGHAATDTGVSFASAVAHYDDTGFAVADIAVGEDSHGIWMSGWVRPWASQEQLHALRASAVSGDWRGVGGQLELIAVLSVNTPGYQIPRLQSSLHNGKQMSLVASGVVPLTQEAKHAGMAATADSVQLTIERALDAFEQRNIDRQLASWSKVFEPTMDEQITAMSKAFE